MSVKYAVKFLVILFYLLFFTQVSLAAAIHDNEKDLAVFNNAIEKIETLIDSNVSLAHKELQGYASRFDELSLQQKITFKHLLSDIYILQGQFHLAKKTASEGLTLTLKLSSPSLLISELLYSRGFSHESMGDIESATNDYERGLELAKSLHNNVLIAKGLVNLGAIYYLTDKYENSLIVLNDAYNIAKQTNDEELKGSVNSELGILYALLERNEQAMVYYQQAYQHYKNANKVILSLNALINIGLNHLHEKEYEQAIIAYQTIIKESDGIELDQILYSAYSGLAWANLKKVNPNTEASYQYLLLSKKYMESIEQYDIEFQYSIDEAFVLFELERFDEVIDSIAKVENILRKQMPLGQVKMQSRIAIINLKSKTYFALGQFQQAYDLQELRLSLTRAMVDQKHIQSIAEVRLSLEAKEADLHKEVLKNEQTIQEISLLEAQKKQKKQTLYLFFIAIVALIFAWLLVKLIQGQRKLSQASRFDMLTGVANRNVLMKKGWKLLSIAKAKKTDFSVIIVNIDHFNELNVKLGHAVGDQVLRKVVDLGEGFMRKTDVFGRFSGEEFVAFLPHTSTSQAKLIAQRYLSSVEKYDWHSVHPSLTSLVVTLSIGIVNNADVTGEDKFNLTALINKAERLLYQAKNKGRNRVCS